MARLQEVMCNEKQGILKRDSLHNNFSLMIYYLFLEYELVSLNITPKMM